MTGVDPAVEAPGERVGHAVGVAVAEDAVEDIAAVGAAVAVGVAHQVDVGDVVDDRLAARRVGEQADRDVQAVGERLDLAGAAVGAEVGEDLDRVASRRPLRLGEGVLQCVGHPEPAAVVEGQVERLVDVRLRRHELDLEAGRQVQRLALVLGRSGGSVETFSTGAGVWARLAATWASSSNARTTRLTRTGTPRITDLLRYRSSFLSTARHQRAKATARLGSCHSKNRRL